MEHTTSDGHIHADQATASSRIHLGSGPQRPARETSTLSSLGSLARGAAGQAGSASAAGFRRLGESLGSRTGALRMVQERPLLAIGAAVSIGFALGYLTETKEGNRHVERVRRRARALLLSKIAAASAALLPLLAGEGRMIDAVGDWMDEHDEDDDEDDF